MGGWIAIAAATMMCAVIIQHLGLSEAVALTVVKIASCYKCLAFWLTFAVLAVLGANISAAAMLSVLMSYLSHYFALILEGMQKLYNKLWERANR